jgi:hypothetical protein
MTVASMEEILLLDMIDEQTRDSLQQLQQKLEGLLLEVDAKLSQEDIPQQSKLLNFKDEIEKALNGMSRITTLTIEHDMSRDEFMQHHQSDVHEFKQLVNDNVEKISKIEELN